MPKAKKNQGYEVDAEYVSFATVAEKLGLPCKFLSQYVYGTMFCRNLGEGLRFKNLAAGRHNPNELMILKSDIATFVKRYRKHHPLHIKPKDKTRR